MAAREALVQVQRLRPLVTFALPPLSMQIWLDLIHTYLNLGDVTGARTMMREATELLERRPQLGVLAEEAEELRGRVGNTAAQPHRAHRD